MQIRVGCSFRYKTTHPTAAVFQVQPRPDGTHRLLREDWRTTPIQPQHAYSDLYGNLCQRLTIPTGEFTLGYDAIADVSDQPDEIHLELPQTPVDRLPNETLFYTLPSRYCLSDMLADTAWDLFGSCEPGWTRVQAICDWVHTNIEFQYGASNAQTTAVDVFQNRRGVCRDFAHLGVTFCRACNIPARYVFGYLPDIGVPVTDATMDFCAWFEAFLDGRWWTFDPRNNIPRVGRVLIGHGRDALDVAMVTTYGPAQLVNMVVWADDAAMPGPTLTPAKEMTSSEPVDPTWSTVGASL